MYHRCHICASLKINQVSATSNTTIIHFSLVFLPHKLDPTRPRGLGHVSEPGGLISRSNHHCSHLIKGHVLDVMYVCVFSHMNGEIDPLHTRLYLTFYTFFFIPQMSGFSYRTFHTHNAGLSLFIPFWRPHSSRKLFLEILTDMLFHVAFHSSSCGLLCDRNVPWLVLFSTEAEQLWDIVILSAGDVATIPNWWDFPSMTYFMYALVLKIVQLLFLISLT